MSDADNRQRKRDRHGTPEALPDTGHYNFPSWNYGYTLIRPSPNNPGEFGTFKDPSLGNDSIGSENKTRNEEKPKNENEPSGTFEVTCPIDTLRNANTTSTSLLINGMNKDEVTENATLSSAIDKDETGNFNNITPNILEHTDDSDKKKKTRRGGTRRGGRNHKRKSFSQDMIQINDAALSVQLAEAQNTIEERSLDEILVQGRNPISYCSDESKTLKLELGMEFMGESGPPHTRMFTWCLILGDIKTIGAAKNKKFAKKLAAEEMAKKIDLLIRMAREKRKQQCSDDGKSSDTANSSTPSKYIFPKISTMESLNPIEFSDSSPKRQKVVDASAINTCNNPVSKLYEHCKKANAPEPLFDTAIENILERKRSYIMGKAVNSSVTEFTIQCDVLGQTYHGTALTKKDAKQLAAVAALEAITGVGDVEQYLIPTTPSPPPPMPPTTNHKQSMTVGEMIAQAKVQHKVNFSEGGHLSSVKTEDSQE